MFSVLHLPPCQRTGDSALAGISGGGGSDSVGRGGDVVAAVLDDDGVPACPVGDVRHQVGSVTVVVDGGLPGFTILVLERREDGTECIYYIHKRKKKPLQI